MTERNFSWNAQKVSKVNYNRRLRISLQSSDSSDSKSSEPERLSKLRRILGLGGGTGGPITRLKLGTARPYTFMLPYVPNVEEWG